MIHNSRLHNTLMHYVPNWIILFCRPAHYFHVCNGESKLAEYHKIKILMVLVYKNIVKDFKFLISEM